MDQLSVILIFTLVDVRVFPQVPFLPHRLSDVDLDGLVAVDIHLHRGRGYVI